jgi:acyl dehydratase
MAHGLLTATLPTKLGGDMNYIARTMTFDFLKPVFSGDVLTCDGTVVSSAVQSARYKVRFSFEVRNQDGEVVLTGMTAGLIKR